MPDSVFRAMESRPAKRAKSQPIVFEDEEIFEPHIAGKLSVQLRSPLDTERALSIAYTPGVPSPLDPRVAPAVPAAVAAAADPAE